MPDMTYTAFMQLTSTLDGVVVHADNYVDFERIYEEAWFAEMDRFPAIIMDYIRASNWPQKTGASYYGFSVESDVSYREAVFEIYNTQPYPKYVEHGTRYITPRNILQNTLDDVVEFEAEDLGSRIANRMQGDLERLGVVDG